ncbi:D-alanine--D-alanine ligase [Methylophaga frappieri]|uniref:D-alanine--D-alanine ligase n=1 Tax=Methylophaga frappieri (strain ATCC BAA-2434 / DSM 25690 / JAM7) TaxID=754477 RepID=I1YGJ2_METFJ|nr:D-alanine--D-alanine ligase [Methylophaga frappieri]AFJ02035.1 D-alanine--D-alanine ligase [Methylophaga frappieri]
MMDQITDPKAFGRVAVLMGGRSAEREISLKSGNAVLSALLAKGVEAVGIDVDSHIDITLREGQFDRAFIVLHGRGGEDGEIQGLLQAMAIPFTGSGVTGAMLSMNKRISKLIWQQQALSTPKFRLVNAETDPQELVIALGLPLVIKPVHEGSSIGMSKVTDGEAIAAAIRLALQFDQDVIAEQWINGAEYTASILAGNALPVIRLKTPREFYDFEAKYHANNTEYLCPCGLTEEQEKRCQALALDAFNALQMKGWGRVDVMADQQGNFYLLEANGVPGMTDHSLVPMAARETGLDFQQLCWRILETSLEEKN